MSDFPVLDRHHKRPSWFWRVIFIGSPIALVFGSVGFWIYDNKPPGVTPWFDAIYHSTQLFILHMPHTEGPINWWLEVGRWLAAGIFGMAALIALYDIVLREMQHFRLKFAEKHTVICGVGPKVIELVRCFVTNDKRRPVVVIAPEEEDYAPYYSAGAIVIAGNPANPANLAKAQINSADEIIAVCSDDNVNVQVAVETSRLVRQDSRSRPDPLRCFVHLADVDLRASLHRTATFGNQSCRLRFFDLYDAAARRFLLEPIHLRADSPYKPLDHGGIERTDPRSVHLVILGFGRMGRTVAVRAAQLGHFANGKSIRVSVVDRDASRHKEMLLFRYPNFEKACSIEFHNTEIETKKARDLLESWCCSEDSITSFAVCFDQDSLALEVALRLFPTLKRFDVPLAVRMSRRSGFASLLEEGQANPNLRFQLRGFGMMEDTCCDDVIENLLNETLARAIHECYCHKRKEENGKMPDEPSTQPWENLNDDFKDSNRQQADHIAIKLQSIGCVRARSDDPGEVILKFRDEEVESMAKMEHMRWNAERLLAGWVRGPKDSLQRSNPYIVPWEDLEPKIQDRDRETVRQIPEFLGLIGEKICRREQMPAGRQKPAEKAALSEISH